MPHKHTPHTHIKVHTNPEGSMSVGQWFTPPSPRNPSPPAPSPNPKPATPPLLHALADKSASAYSDEHPDPDEDPYINRHVTINNRPGFISHFENSPTCKVYYFFYDGCDEATQIPAAWFLDNPVSKRIKLV